MNRYAKHSFAVLWQHWKDLVQVLQSYAGEFAAVGL
jgi:hypothetical protein